ncbi:PTS sugar transporter subunit IIC [Clostridium sp.]|uniref:PTS transporter subunit IIC n=1 Tax=Clostridium sp. TaxID=1506 RepID=UPI00258A1F55|nr:PTS sugar transporter subunit IIC [Clostridium sp.]MDF2504100.1 putative rane protein putative toxin regulator [Clostridium sp.]
MDNVNTSTNNIVDEKEYAEDKKKESKKDIAYKVAAGIANAILVMLGIGLLCETIGKFIHWQAFIGIGTIAKSMLAPAIGAGVAYQLGGNTLIIFSAMIAATVGGNAVHFTPAGLTFVSGQPISAVVASLIAVYVGKAVSGKTKLDMMAIPFAAVVVGGVAGLGLAAVTTPALNWLSAQIAYSINISPLIGSAIVSLSWSILLMSPASSAAIAIALKLDPVSSAAALIGCTVQFVGFTIMSFKENDAGANIAQGLVTPKVQFPNIIKNPKLVIPTFLASLICAPIAIVLFKFSATYELAGLGLNSLIAPLNITANQGIRGLSIYILTGIILPSAIIMPIYFAMKKSGLIKDGDMHMKIQ